VRKGGPVCFFTAGSPAFDISLLLEALKRIQRMKQSQSHGVLKPRHNPQICRIECTGRRSLTLDDMVDRHEELAAVRHAMEWGRRRLALERTTGVCEQASCRGSVADQSLEPSAMIVKETTAVFQRKSACIPLVGGLGPELSENFSSRGSLAAFPAVA
jgi:hypothetical protein